MNKFTHKIIPLALAMTLVSASGVATANNGHFSSGADAERGHHRGKQGIFSQLGLSDDQKLAIRSVKENERAEMELYKESQQAFKEAVKAIIQADSFEEAALRQLQLDNQDDFVSIQVLHASSKSAVWNILTADQQAQLDTLKEEKAAEREGAEPRDPMKMFERLGLTDEQASSLEAIFDEAADTKDSFDDAMKAFKDSMKSLIQSEEFDTTAAEALVLANISVFQDIGVAKAEVKNLVWNVLTPEQQAMMENMKEKRRKHRHSSGARFAGV